MSIEDVHTWISHVPYSKFYLADSKQISRLMTVNNSRRYLAQLILTNEQNKSDLREISEASQNKELSIRIKLGNS